MRHAFINCTNAQRQQKGSISCSKELGQKRNPPSQALLAPASKSLGPAPRGESANAQMGRNMKIDQTETLCGGVTSLCKEGKRTPTNDGKRTPNKPI